jgi:hypothetical protein
MAGRLAEAVESDDGGASALPAQAANPVESRAARIPALTRLP